MRLLYGKRPRDFLGRREILILIGTFLVAELFTLVSDYGPLDVLPNLALCPVIGLLFGPWGVIGVNLSSLINNVMTGVPPAYCALDLVTVFIVSYLPYRIWYSTAMDKDDRPPVLDSVRNVAKFFLVIVISSLIYTVLYNASYGMMEGTFVLDLEDFVRFINVISFSLLFGLAAILLLRYLGVKFYTPKFGGTPDGRRRAIDPQMFDTALVLALFLPVVVLSMVPEGWVMYLMTAVAYALLIFYLLKPVEKATTDENLRIYRGMTFNKFNRSLIEKIIVIFIVYALFIGLVFGACAAISVLDDMMGLGTDVTVLFYISVGLLVFFVPSLLFLWYIEKNVTVPISVMSDAARDFISETHEFSSEEFAYSCKDFYETDSEIGELARSLVKMTGDMEDYVEKLRNLNNQQEKFRAELNVAQNIQESFIPRDFSIIDGKGASIAGDMMAAKYVGGDFYDFFMIDNDHLALTIGDVSGKGVPAALFMAVTESQIQGQSRPGLRPDEILGKVNIALCRNNIENMFVTCWLGILELGTGVLRYCSAGHNPPVIARAGAEPELLETVPSLVLGAKEGVRYTSGETQLNPGDRVLLYTDGVTEANDHFNGFYGTDRLMRVLSECTGDLRDQVDTITKDIAEFTNQAAQFDDITVLLLRYDGTGSGQLLLDGEDVPVPVAPVGDTVDVLLDQEDT